MKDSNRLIVKPTLDMIRMTIADDRERAIVQMWYDRFLDARSQLSQAIELDTIVSLPMVDKLHREALDGLLIGLGEMLTDYDTRPVRHGIVVAYVTDEDCDD